jgi:septal ring factor EnvC (AmiA/AmiB activator)
MRRAFSLTLLIIVAVFMTAVSSAYARMNIPEQIATQQKRIDNGVATGQLSRQEAGVLQENLEWIKQRFHRLTNDGLLTPRERANLEKMLNRNSVMISNKKHNPIGSVHFFAIQSRIDDQQSRIRRGVSSRQLTRQEAAILQDNLNWIKKRLARLKADGRLSGADREQLERMLDDNGKMIIREKRDAAIRRLY